MICIFFTIRQTVTIAIGVQRIGSCCWIKVWLKYAAIRIRLDIVQGIAELCAVLDAVIIGINITRISFARIHLTIMVGVLYSIRDAVIVGIRRDRGRT